MLPRHCFVQLLSQKCLNHKTPLWTYKLRPTYKYIKLHLFFLLHRKSLASSPPSFSGGYNLYSHRGVQDLRWIFVSAIYGIKKSILAFH